MPTENTSSTLRQVLSKRLKPKKSSRYPLASPRSQNLAEEEPIYLEIASSCRARQCMQNSQEVLANRLIALADVVCALANPATTKEKAAKILIFCDDGYVSVFPPQYFTTTLTFAHPDRNKHFRLDLHYGFSKTVLARSLPSSPVDLQEIFLCVPIRRAIPVLDRTKTCSTTRLT